MSPPKFQIVHKPIPEDDDVLLQRAATHDLATVYFHDELERLKRERAYGELAVLRINGDAQKVVREPLR
jgi:hypothetical protein